MFHDEPSELAKLELCLGPSRMRFVPAEYARGEVFSTLFYWPSDVKVIICDVDGTVTRSDVMGHMVTTIGGDWAHPGVCELLSALHDAGFRVLYLTSRPRSMLNQTRSYLQRLRQGRFALPLGPVWTSPHATVDALRQEVVIKDAKFKIGALRELKAVLDSTGSCRVVAGLGNRTTDRLSYESIGLSTSSIFIVDRTSQVICGTGERFASYQAMVPHLPRLFGFQSNSPSPT
jgi:phosphatidate phosphatase LPIN